MRKLSNLLYASLPNYESNLDTVALDLLSVGKLARYIIATGSTIEYSLDGKHRPKTTALSELHISRQRHASYVANTVGMEQKKSKVQQMCLR